MFEHRSMLFALLGLLVTWWIAGVFYPYVPWMVYQKEAIKRVSTFTRGLGSGSGRGLTRVLIVTYMRSGSSLTGDILQQTPGAFYNYEPIRLLRNAGRYTFLNGTEREVNEASLRQHYIDVTTKWLTCDISNIYVQGLRDPFLRYGIKTKKFQRCKKALGPDADVISNSTLRYCALVLTDLCFDSPVRIIKTIRLPLEWAGDLLRKFSDLKIVHLVRDPRATLLSRAEFGRCPMKQGGLLGCTNEQCTRLENDMMAKRRLSEEFPDRLRTFFYEDIAMNPIKTSKFLYDYVGTQYTPTVEGYIVNITRAGNTDNCVICTTRRNSTEHVDTWKKAPTKLLNIIQARCNLILKHYGYD